MSWEFKANWPIKKGDEITHVHFEDLRKLFYSLDIGLYSIEEPDFYGDIPEWTSGTNFEWGGRCIFEGFMYTYCHPDEDIDNIPRPSPAVTNDWVRTARRWIYSDFNPSNACHFVNYYASEQIWVTAPAWMRLPAPLNPYVQRVRQVDEDPEYELIRPAEEKHQYEQIRPVRFMKYFNDPRYNYGFNQYGGLKEIITGKLGAVYQGVSTYTGNYHKQHGNPHEGSPIYDIKMGGYQSYVERLCDTFSAMLSVDDNFIWEFYDDGEWGPVDPVFERPEPLIAQGRDPHWRCNNSAYEAILKILGEDHYDWYLTNIVSAEDDIDPPERIACWRRMPKHSHGWPEGAILVWPSELGVPPYADEDVSEFPARTSEDGPTGNLGYQLARDWWKNPANVAIAEADAMTALAGADTGMIEDFQRRHTHRVRLYHKDADCPVPVGYPEAIYNEELWWWEDVYELHPGLLNHLKDVLESLDIKRVGAVLNLSFDQKIKRLLPNPAFDQFEDTFEEGRDYGSWQAEEVFSPDVATASLGFGSEDTLGSSVRGQRRPSCSDQNAVIKFRRSVSNACEWLSVFKIGDITLDELEYLLDSDICTDVFLRVLIGGYPTLRGQHKPDDTDSIAYNIPDISAGDIETAAIRANPYDPMRPDWVHFDHLPEQRNYDLKVDQSWGEVFTKPPPDTTAWEPVMGEWDPCWTTNSLLARITVSSDSPQIAVGVDPHKIVLRSYLMDDPPCKI